MLAADAIKYYYYHPLSFIYSSIGDFIYPSIGKNIYIIYI